MCQIYVRETDCKKLPDNIVLDEMFYNRDGAGIAYVEHNKLQVYKTFDYALMDSKVKELEQNNKTFIVHFRMTTAGNNTLDNIHPFFITDDLVMFHNGTINTFRGDKEKSDTRLLAEYLKELGVESIDDIRVLEPMLIELIGTSYDKLVFMDSTEQVYIINSFLGTYASDSRLWSSSVSPWAIYEPTKKSKKKNSVSNISSYYDNYYDYDDSFDYIKGSNSIEDSFGNFSPDEIDLLQYIMDYEPHKLKSLISQLTKELT